MRLKKIKEPKKTKSNRGRKRTKPIEGWGEHEKYGLIFVESGIMWSVNDSLATVCLGAYHE